jgi:hypothetical protein
MRANYLSEKLELGHATPGELLYRDAFFPAVSISKTIHGFEK